MKLGDRAWQAEDQFRWKDGSWVLRYSIEDAKAETRLRPKL
jgi:hypothetical protein